MCVYERFNVAQSILAADIAGIKQTRIDNLMLQHILALLMKGDKSELDHALQRDCEYLGNLELILLKRACCFLVADYNCTMPSVCNIEKLGGSVANLSFTLNVSLWEHVKIL